MLISFIVYLIILMAIAIYSSRFNNDLEDYLVAGRKLGIFATALSDKASDLSGWLILGIPGQAFTSGISAFWLAIGNTAGNFINWTMVALRFRKYTEKLKALTIPDFLESRYRDKTNAIRIISIAIILLYMTIYIQGQFVAGAKTLGATFNLSYAQGLLITVTILVAYTFIGGFFAVAWTDVIQGMLMVTLMIALPIVGIVNFGGIGNFTNALAATGADKLDPLGGATGFAALIIIISYMSWMVGYPGQPHVITRYMACESAEKLRRPGIFISMIWVIFALWGSVTIGLVGLAKYGSLPDPEQTLPLLVGDLFPAWLGGITLAAMMAAIMSTADSQLLVASSALSEDIFRKFKGDTVSETKLLWVGRISVIVISLISLSLALMGTGSIYWIVASAWGGLAAGFGPAILVSLWWKRSTKAGLITGLIIGPVFNFLGTIFSWESTLFGGIPTFFFAFFLALACNIIVSSFTKPPQGAEQEFDELMDYTPENIERLHSADTSQCLEFALKHMDHNMLFN